MPPVRVGAEKVVHSGDTRDPSFRGGGVGAYKPQVESKSLDRLLLFIKISFGKNQLFGREEDLPFCALRIVGYLGVGLSAIGDKNQWQSLKDVHSL